MPKGYWIANNIVQDLDEYARYKEANGAVFARYGARFVVRGGTQEAREGDPYPRTVVIEFPSYGKALACYDDPEYQAAKAIREPISQTRLVIVEGYDG